MTKEFTWLKLDCGMFTRWARVMSAERVFDGGGDRQLGQSVLSGWEDMHSEVKLLTIWPFCVSVFLYLSGAFHMPDILVAEGSRLRLALLKLYARFEVQLLKVFWFVFHTPLVRVGITRRFLYRSVAKFLAEHAIAGQFMTLGEVFRFIDGLPDVEGSIAVGPCRCRLAVKKRAGCSHPMETDIVVAEGAPIWLDLFPQDYRIISKEEAKEIVRECYRQGMAPGVYRHMYYRGSRNFFVICNCCKEACIPVIGYRVFKPEGMKFIDGSHRSFTEEVLCVGCGTCVEVCPFEERLLVAGKAVPLSCRGCGLCASRCPRGAAYMEPRDGTDAHSGRMR